MISSQVLRGVFTKKPLFHRCFSQSHIALSGHNKWSKIKQKKGAADIKKSNAYAKAARDIIVAIKTGGSGDPVKNTTLANVLKAAKASGVPRDNIERAISRATGEAGKDSSAHVVYEAMVGGNIGVIIECLTDNSTRTIHKLRETLNEYSGRFTPVKFLFDKVGRVQVSVPDTDNRDARIEAILDSASTAGGEDFEILEGTNIVEYYCPSESLEAMTKAISELTGGEDIVSSEDIFRAKDTPGEVEESLAEEIAEMREAFLEGEGDCVRVWTTIDSLIRIEGE